MKSNSGRPIEATTEIVVSAEAEENISFSSLGISDELCRMVKELGYEAPTPIQVKSIPILLSGRDLIGQAQTGTGKTAAFALPLLTKIDFNLDEPQILVLTPTRELAIQVAEAFKSYARANREFHVLPIYGGQSIGIQLRQLSRKPQVIVGTPGRVMDHLRRKTLSFSALKALVIDEADEMLSMGFLEDIEWILAHTPKEKQTTLFSATMPNEIRRVAQAYLSEPEEIVIKKVASEAALISQSFWFVNGLHKLDALTRILEASEFDAALVFVRTKNAAVELAEKLEARGYAAGALNGDMSQDNRERTIHHLKSGRLDILVATDVAARGLDVERISHVINYDIPFDGETYTHRIGRTGRAGRSGTAVLFVSPRERGLLKSIERDARVRLDEFRMPTRSDIHKRRIEKFKLKVVSALNTPNVQSFDQLVEELAQENNTSEKTIGAALLSMMQQEFISDPEPIEVYEERRPERSQWKRNDWSERKDRERSGSGRSGASRPGPGRFESSRSESGRPNSPRSDRSDSGRPSSGRSISSRFDSGSSNMDRSASQGPSSQGPVSQFKSRSAGGKTGVGEGRPDWKKKGPKSKNKKRPSNTSHHQTLS